MDDLKLIPGQTYYVKVTEFRAKGKTITKQDQKQYELFYVRVQDDEGKSAFCEFACLQGECKPDTFVMGVKQYVRCIITSPRGTPEIEPTDEPGTQTNNPDQSHEGPNAYAMKVQGSSYAFALGYANQLKIAEIGQQPFGFKLSDKDIDDVVKWAEKLHGAIAERISF